VVDIADEDALTEVAGGGFANLGCLCVGLGRDAGDVEAGDAAIEPEAGYVWSVSRGDFGVKIEEDADVVAAGLVDEVVEIVEGAVGWIDFLGVGSVRLDGGKEDRVGAEGLDVVEMLGDAVEAAACCGVDWGIEVEGVYLVDDGVLPPEFSAHA
jgi:hypothetical protein